jgi:hypothetical protein
MSDGVYNGTTTSCIYVRYAPAPHGGSLFDTSSSYIVIYNNADTDLQVASVAYDATNITLTWTKTGSPTGTLQIMWEAQG